MININNISFSYKEKKIFENASLNITKNGVYILKGSNGTGKSTLLKIIKGEIEPKLGNINIDVDTQSISYLSQNEKLVSFLDADENASLENFINGRKLKREYKKKNNELSNGQKVKLIINRIFNEEKQIVLLDEFSDFIDDNNVNELIELLKKESKNRIIIIASHDPRILNSFNNSIEIIDYSLQIKFNEVYDINHKQIICKKNNSNSVIKRLFKYYYKSFSFIFFMLFILFSIIIGILNITFYPKYRATLKENVAYIILDNGNSKLDFLDNQIKGYYEKDLSLDKRELIEETFEVVGYCSEFYGFKIGDGDGFYHLKKDDFEHLSKLFDIDDTYIYLNIRNSKLKIKYLLDDEYVIYENDIYNYGRFIDSVDFCGAMWECDYFDFSKNDGLYNLLNDYGRISFISPSIFSEKYGIDIDESMFYDDKIFPSKFLNVYYVENELNFYNYTNLDLGSFYNQFIDIRDVLNGKKLEKNEEIQGMLKRNEILVSESDFLELIKKIEYRNSPIVNFKSSELDNAIIFLENNNLHINGNDYLYHNDTLNRIKQNIPLYTSIIIYIFCFIILFLHLYSKIYIERNSHNIYVLSRYFNKKRTIIIFLIPLILIIMSSSLLAFFGGTFVGYYLGRVYEYINYKYIMFNYFSMAILILFSLIFNFLLLIFNKLNYQKLNMNNII